MKRQVKPKPELNVAAVPASMHINVKIHGEDVARFLRYKSSQFLQNKSEAGRKLMLERLAQIDAEQEKTARNAA